MTAWHAAPGGAPESGVVVGYDGSAAARGALLFAAEEARLRGQPLEVVFVREGPLQIGPTPQEVLDEAAAIVRALAGPEHVAFHQAAGAATEDLVARSHGAELVVVGRGRLDLVGALLGSVAVEVITRSTCPCAIVSDDGGVGQDKPPEAPVVVGLGDDAAASLALLLAFEEAERRGAPLSVVHAWRHPVLTIKDGRPRLDFDAEGLGAAQKGSLDAVLRPYRERHPGVAVTVSVERGRRGATLEAAARSARLLVLGRHARPLVAGLPHARLALHLARHVRCPVLLAAPAERTAAS
jgi:nucleotide-binding universal stress UspA family protein